MYLFSADDIRLADRKAVDHFGVPPIILMENAARGVAEIVGERFPAASRILVACGGGNNGGDGLATARHLLKRGRKVTVLLAAPEEKLTPEGSVNLEILKRINCPIARSADLTDAGMRELAMGQDILVDALLGSGSKGAPRGETGRVIGSLSRTVPVVSIDIPSGVDPSTGEVEGEALEAVLTVAILARKIGQEIMPGRSFRGEVETVDLGIEAALLLPGPGKVELLDPLMVSGFLPPLPPFIHKGDRGIVLVIGGSERYRGAPLLAALGALMAGSGGVIAAVPAGSMPMFSRYPEIIPMEACTEDGAISPETWERIVETWKGKFKAVVIGPGLDRGRVPQDLVRRVWKDWDGPLCLDGDALHALSCCSDLDPRAAGTVVTPHEGEAALLLSVDTSEVKRCRYISALELSRRFGVALLKGPSSLVSESERVRVNPHVVAGLSVPGSGDVLSGVLGAFLVRGVNIFDAASSAAFVHGYAGKAVQDRKGPDGITATEIALEVPSVISRIRQAAGKVLL
ncbi:MAG TPA: NAD(P)H-hydrate dehydratase [Synergistales bacterium]|nr:NAD(P)H-hydrate dehydratase [Synergistales bacterium]HQQ11395.1 NAD(P)H-hydrate dehydratase [Synergistales bacterium]